MSMNNSNNQKTEQIKWSDLKGRAVVDIISAKRVGSVEDLVLDQHTYQIVGLKFKSGLFSAAQAVPISAVKGIGEDALTLQLEDQADVASSVEPEPTSQKLPTLSHVIGNGVVTEGGKYLGQISNVHLSLQPLAITGYEMSMGSIFSKTHTFEITSEVHYGEKLVIIPDSLVDVFTPSFSSEDSTKQD